MSDFRVNGCGDAGSPGKRDKSSSSSSPSAASLAARLVAFRAGDTVKHQPSGEVWMLACDQSHGDVLPAGWPETLAKATDCELVESATDDERLEMLTNVAKANAGLRSGLAREQLSEVAARLVEPPQDKGIIAKVRLMVERFRSLGGIPELCDLAWNLCNENEQLRTEIERLLAGRLVDPSPLAHPGQFAMAVLALERLAEERSDPALFVISKRLRAALLVPTQPSENKEDED